jgi:hypothetical protein
MKSKSRSEYLKFVGKSGLLAAASYTRILEVVRKQNEQLLVQKEVIFLF